MASTLTLTLLVATVAVTLALIHIYPTAVRRRFFEPIEGMRTLLGALILVVGVWYALNTGVAWMVGLAIVGAAFITAFLYYEEPHKDIR